MDHVRTVPERYPASGEHAVRLTDVLDREVEHRARPEVLRLGHTQVEPNAVAAEERHRLSRHAEQERHPQDVAVERDRAVDIRHAHVDLADGAEPVEPHDPPPAIDTDRYRA